ncbi:hypothetical protein FACS1894185_4720 [Betaproteobacteria bacterium]|nr:hypothetical protein FACS1894185_4720 [Betaproteobacteria bacterium]
MFLNMHKSKLAIIIPVYNTAPYLDQCIQSALDQGVEDFEIHCFENGSTDESPQILAEWATKDKRIIIHTIANEEWSDIQSVELIGPIECEFLARVDSDDYLVPGFMAKALRVLEEERLDILFFEGEVFYEAQELYDTRNRYYDSAYKYRHNYDEVTSGITLFQNLIDNEEFYVSMCMYVIRKEQFFISRPPKLLPRIKRYGDNYVTALRILMADRARVLRCVGYNRRIRNDSIMNTIVEATDVASLLIVVWELLEFIDSIALEGCPTFALAHFVSVLLGQAVETAESLSESEGVLWSSLIREMGKSQAVFALAVLDRLQSYSKLVISQSKWLDAAVAEREALRAKSKRQDVWLDAAVAEREALRAKSKRQDAWLDAAVAEREALRAKIRRLE